MNTYIANKISTWSIKYIWFRKLMVKFGIIRDFEVQTVSEEEAIRIFRSAGWTDEMINKAIGRK